MDRGSRGIVSEGCGALLEGCGTMLEGHGAPLEGCGAPLEDCGARLEGCGTILGGRGAPLGDRGELTLNTWPSQCYMAWLRYVIHYERSEELLGRSVMGAAPGGGEALLGCFEDAAHCSQVTAVGKRELLLHDTVVRVMLWQCGHMMCACTGTWWDFHGLWMWSGGLDTWMNSTRFLWCLTKTEFKWLYIRQRWGSMFSSTATTSLLTALHPYVNTNATRRTKMSLAIFRRNSGWARLDGIMALPILCMETVHVDWPYKDSRISTGIIHWMQGVLCIHCDLKEVPRVVLCGDD